MAAVALFAWSYNAGSAALAADPRRAEPALKVVGLERVVTYPASSECFEKNAGCNYHYESGRKFLLALYTQQIQDVFRVTDETNHIHELSYDWRSIWNYNTGAGPERGKADVVYGQYDFEGKMPDSLVVVSAVEDAGRTKCGVNIYNLRRDRWVLAGKILAPDVIGDCVVTFKVNKVTIPRNLRGFYRQLTFQDGRFKDTGSY